MPFPVTARASPDISQPKVSAWYAGLPSKRPGGAAASRSSISQVIQQVFPAGATQTRQSGPVPHHLANGELRFPVGPELGPVLGDRSLVVDQSPVDEPVDDGRRHTLGRREDHRRGVCRPRHLAGPVRPAGPYVDDGLTVEIDRQRPAAEPATGNMLAKPRTTQEKFGSAAPNTRCPASGASREGIARRSTRDSAVTELNLLRFYRAQCRTAIS